MVKNRYSLDDCHYHASLNNGKCLSKEYVNTKQPMRWQCNYNHEWNTSFEKIKDRKQWCPHCAGNVRLDIEDCYEVAEKNNGKCLSKEYKNANSLLLWECNSGHKWNSTYGNIYAGKWCRICAGLDKKTIEDCYKIAEKNDGKCISNNYINALSVLTWQCKDGHIWKANYNNINRGQWCPECRSGKSQNKLYCIISEIYPEYNIRQNFTDFVWLKSKNGRKQEIDIWVPELKLAIEYDGVQHFKPTRFGGISPKKAKSNLKYIKMLDKIKTEKIKQHQEDVNYFMRFNYTEPLSKEYVVLRLTTLGI